MIDVINTGIAAQTVSLGIYDARDGTKIGAYTIPSIPSGGQFLVDSGGLESAAHITPSDGRYHYVVKANASFTGFLQHLVNNQRSGVITDMTTVCAM
jgi:hypothetical protein